MFNPVPDPVETKSSAPLVSTLASDPDMAELVQFFVDEIDDRINTIQATARTNDIVGLRTVAHTGEKYTLYQPKNYARVILCLMTL